MALSAPRDTLRLNQAQVFEFDLAAGAIIHRGAFVALNAAGAAQQGATAATLTAVGRAESEPGEIPGRVRVLRGVFRWKNSTAADAIGPAEWGKTVYLVDDETVAKTNANNTRSVAGICRGVDAGGVWVES